MSAPEPLDFDELMPKAAELRAGGSSWNQAGEKLKQSPDDLKALSLEYRADWRKLLSSARREVIGEAFAEAMNRLRKNMRLENDKRADRAAEVLLKLWMTLVRHRRKGPPREDNDDGELEGLTDEDYDRLFGAAAEQLKPRPKPPDKPDDDPPDGGAPVPRPDKPDPGGGGAPASEPLAATAADAKRTAGGSFGDHPREGEDVRLDRGHQADDAGQ